MKVKVLMFTRTKKLVIRKISFDKPVIEGGRYYLRPDLVCTKIENDKIKGEEILYFEGNPDPIGQIDKSADFLDRMVGENYIRQTSGVKKPRIPFNKTWIMVGGIVILVCSVSIMYYLGFLKVIL